MRALAACLAVACALFAVAAGAAPAAPADLDRSFGGDGVIQDEASARMAIGPHDEVFVLYSSFSPCTGPVGECRIELSLVRYDPSGNRDPAFGAGPGSQFEVRQSPLEHEFALAIGPDGRPVVAASSSGTMEIARFDAAGHLDGGFGSGGVVQVGFPGGVYSAPAVSVQADGKVVVGVEGGHDEGTVSNLLLARFMPNGERDPASAAAAKSSPPLATRSWPVGLMLGGDGTISVASPQCCGGSPLFGGGGPVSIPRRVGSVDPSGIAIDAKGRIVGVGWDGKLAAFRLAANGGKDRTFNGGEHVSLSIGGNQEAPLGIAVQASGRIVVLGEASCCGPKAVTLVGLRGSTDRSRCLRHRATIVGTRRADELVGTPRRDVIAALGGRDEVRGLGGADLICGGKGRDKLLGGPGRDRVRQ